MGNTNDTDPESTISTPDSVEHNTGGVMCGRVGFEAYSEADEGHVEVEFLGGNTSGFVMLSMMTGVGNGTVVLDPAQARAVAERLDEVADRAEQHPDAE